MTLLMEVKKIRQLVATVRAGFFKLDAVKNIPYKREALNIAELVEELDTLEGMTKELERRLAELEMKERQ